MLSLVAISLSVLLVKSAPTETSYEDFINIGVNNMSHPIDTLFQLFKDTHERKYERFVEEEKRRKIFADNVRFINKHNVKYASGESTYYLGINQFTDMTYTEFAEQYANLQSEDMWTGNSSIFLPPENYEAPSTVDWRQKDM